MAAPAPAGIRTPIVCVLGHVDHGKTSLLDRIRGSSVVDTEEGAITQHIGATLVPLDAIRTMSGSLGKLDIQVPGLLFIDTPGHHAFTTLRARGGALAEMAILVVDVNEGFQPQTLEALEILRNCKTPFVVAATKIDRIPRLAGERGRALPEHLCEAGGAFPLAPGEQDLRDCGEALRTGVRL